MLVLCYFTVINSPKIMLWSLAIVTIISSSLKSTAIVIKLNYKFTNA